LRFGWVAEPDSDRGDVDGAGVDVFAFVVAGGDGAGLAEFVDGAFDDVAVLVGLGVEVGSPTWAGRVAGELVGLQGDGRLDAASAQAGADRGVGVGLVGQDTVGSGAGTSTAAARDP
jgi:hypothetical protein